MTTGDTRSFDVDPPALADLSDYVAEWMPGLDPVPVDATTCLYTSTPTEDFVLDRSVRSSSAPASRATASSSYPRSAASWRRWPPASPVPGTRSGWGPVGGPGYWDRRATADGGAPAGRQPGEHHAYEPEQQRVSATTAHSHQSEPATKSP